MQVEVNDGLEVIELTLWIF